MSRCDGAIKETKALAAPDFELLPPSRMSWAEDWDQSRTQVNKLRRRGARSGVDDGQKALPLSIGPFDLAAKNVKRHLIVVKIS